MDVDEVPEAGLRPEFRARLLETVARALAARRAAAKGDDDDAGDFSTRDQPAG